MPVSSYLTRLQTDHYSEKISYIFLTTETEIDVKYSELKTNPSAWEVNYE